MVRFKGKEKVGLYNCVANDIMAHEGEGFDLLFRDRGSITYASTLTA